MAWILFLLFVALPIAEIAVLIQAGEAIGLWPTIGLVILTAAAGAALARAEGRAAMQRLANSVEAGEAPVGPILDAAGVFVGGILLLTPGFITDGLGLSLLFGPTRRLWGALFVWLKRRGDVGYSAGGYAHRPDGQGPHGHGQRPGGPTVIEGEYVETDSRRPDEPDSGPPRP